jgi:hypothetical protein
VLMRSALFWNITQRRMVILYRRSGQRIGPIFDGQVVQEEQKPAGKTRCLYWERCGRGLLAEWETANGRGGRGTKFCILHFIAFGTFRKVAKLMDPFIT